MARADGKGRVCPLHWPAMPIYQYDCADCERRVEVFFRSVSSAGSPACPECDGTQLTRVMSQFARSRSAYDRANSINLQQEMSRLHSDDSGDFSRWARRVGEDYDVELGSNFRELADRADAGDDPVERIDPAHTLRHAINERKKKTGKPKQEGRSAGD